MLYIGIDVIKATPCIIAVAFAPNSMSYPIVIQNSKGQPISINTQKTGDPDRIACSFRRTMKYGKKQREALLCNASRFCLTSAVTSYSFDLFNGFPLQFVGGMHIDIQRDLNACVSQHLA